MKNSSSQVYLAHLLVSYIFALLNFCKTTVFVAEDDDGERDKEEIARQLRSLQEK